MEVLTPRQIENEIIGSLLVDPMLMVSDIGMSILPTDFQQDTSKQIHSAMSTLFASNLVVNEKEIIKFLQTVPNIDTDFLQEYIFTAKNIAEPKNFNYNVDLLKKYGLLRDLATFCDISSWYTTAPVSFEIKKEMEEKLVKCTISDILENIFGRVVALSDPYVQTSETMVQDASDGIDALLDSLEEAPDYGVPLFDPVLTTITKGCRKTKLYCVSGGTGVGKSVPNDTIIPTPKGFRRVDEIKIGDKLFDRLGKPTTVLGVFPQGEKKVFEVTFEDGRTALCNDEHLWSVYVDDNEYFNTFTLKELMKYPQRDYYIPANGAVEGISQNRPSLFKQCAYNRIIPSIIWRSSIEERKAFLEITDELDDLTFTIEFAEQIANLKRSVGIQSIVRTFNDGIHATVIDFPCNKIKITNIRSLGYSTPMTCFMVDNSEHLFLMNDYIVTHNTRMAIAQAVNMSIPVSWDIMNRKWVYSGADEKVGICSTELQVDEMQTIILATISGVDEDHILECTMTDEEKKRVRTAAAILKKYEGNLTLWRMPDPNIKQIVSGVRRMKLTHQLDALFFDYIHTSPNLIQEYAGQIREDVALLLIVNALKNLANELNLFIWTGTQYNAHGMTDEFITENCLRGSRSIADKLDFGAGLRVPTKEELSKIQPIIASTSMMPNMFLDVYKNRRSRFKSVRVWMQADLGRMRYKVLYVTDWKHNLVECNSTYMDLGMEEKYGRLDLC